MKKVRPSLNLDLDLSLSRSTILRGVLLWLTEGPHVS